MMRPASLAALCLSAALLAPRGARADDVVVLVNDARVSGRIVSEDARGVVLEQSLGNGHTRLSIPKERIRSIERDLVARAAPAAPAAPATPTSPAAPAAAASPAAARDEWWLLESDGKTVGTRHLSVGPSPDSPAGGTRFEELVVLFAQKHVPAVRVQRIEDADDRLSPRSFHYRESGD